jgi:DNA-binding transcriptional LysR family regulator
MFDVLFAERGFSMDRLRVLVEVQSAGSIAQAVPGDPVRQSQYSRQLRELSEFFGCELAERKGKTLRLTARGVRLAELARGQLTTLTDFHADCRAEAKMFSIAAGDSLVQWLVIPRLGTLLSRLRDVQFSTFNLRTHDIVSQITDGRSDFGLLRKNALPEGLKSTSLGRLNYVLIAPRRICPHKKAITLAEALSTLPLAMQTTDGQFTSHLSDIAKALGVRYQPVLCCQSFPQTMSAVRSGYFAAVVPAQAAIELDTSEYHVVEDAALKPLARDIFLAWHPRLPKVRSGAAQTLSELQKTFRF